MPVARERDVRRLDVERVLLEVRLPRAERDAGLHEALQHADVVGRPDVARRTEDDGAGQPIAAEQQLAIRRPVRVQPADRLRLRVVPGAERRHVEMADLDDVREQAAAVADALARHVGADHAPVLLRRRLDRVHRGLAGDEVVALGDVARGVDVRDVRAQLIVDDDAALDRDARVLQPVEVRADAGGHDDDVAHEVARPTLKRRRLLALWRPRSPVTALPVRIVTPCLLEPLLHQLRRRCRRPCAAGCAARSRRS